MRLSRRGKVRPSNIWDRLLLISLRAAGDLGLVIATDRDRGNPLWSIRCRESGRLVLTYRPLSLRYWFVGLPGGKGEVKEFRDALLLAAARVRKGEGIVRVPPAVRRPTA